jgi:hypothetical protein
MSDLLRFFISLVFVAAFLALPKGSRAESPQDRTIEAAQVNCLVRDANGNTRDEALTTSLPGLIEACEADQVVFSFMPAVEKAEGAPPLVPENLRTNIRPAGADAP